MQIERTFSQLLYPMEARIRRRNIDQICRLCLEYASDENVLFPLFIKDVNRTGFYGRFAKEFKESIPEIVSACIGIEVKCNETINSSKSR